MLKTVIFDVDGTLLDSEKIYMEAWMKVGADHGYVIPQEALLETRAVSVPVAKKVFEKYLRSKRFGTGILDFEKQVGRRNVFV